MANEKAESELPVETAELHKRAEPDKQAEPQ
jgi:hypothetical protein